GIMEAEPVTDRAAAEQKALKRPRPGHADLAGALKYGRSDLRDILERASARNTAARVAAGAVAKRLLQEIGIDVFSIVDRIGGVALPLPDQGLSALKDAAEASDVRCPDETVAAAMRQKIDEAQKGGDTVGGSFVVVASG